MKTYPIFKASCLIIAGLIFANLALAAGEEDAAWNNVLKKKYFGDRSIDESTSPIELTAPYLSLIHI